MTDLGPIRQRLDAATPGPWQWDEAHGRDVTDEGWSRITVTARMGHEGQPGLVAELGYDQSEADDPQADADFIAHAPTDIAVLLDENEKLRAALSAYPTTETVFIVFDGPPGPESGRFIEVEDANKNGLKLGTWIENADGTWALRVDVISQANLALKEEV